MAGQDSLGLAILHGLGRLKKTWCVFIKRCQLVSGRSHKHVVIESAWHQRKHCTTSFSYCTSTSTAQRASPAAPAQMLQASPAAPAQAWHLLLHARRQVTPINTVKTARCMISLLKQHPPTAIAIPSSVEPHPLRQNSTRLPPILSWRVSRNILSLKQHLSATAVILPNGTSTSCQGAGALSRPPHTAPSGWELSRSHWCLPHRQAHHGDMIGK